MDGESPLRNFLHSIHREPAFKDVRGPTARIELDHNLKRYIFKALYFQIVAKSEDLTHLFPEMTAHYSSFEDVIRTYEQEDTDFYRLYSSHMNAKHSFKHPGRNCGRKFKVGEPLYRCHECGFDDTCVLCINCFNPKDHENHHIYTDICSDFTTGICDCGDEEAWKAELHCKANETENEDGEDDSAMDNFEFDAGLIENVLAEAFDYYIDMFNQNIESLPTFTKDITMKLRELAQEKKEDEVKTFLSDFKYRNPQLSENNDNYVVMIYNDEYHNYSQATTALRQGIPDNVHTDILTSKIDSEGRAMLKCADNVEDLMAGFFAVQTNGLCATLISWDEYIHQESCKYIIQWVAHSLTIPNANFQFVFRNSLGKVLCSAGNNNLQQSVKATEVITKYFPNKLPESYTHRYLDQSILDSSNELPVGYHKTLPQESLNSISNTINKTVAPQDKTYANTRLQFLLYFDNRFWKRLRKDIQNVIIPTLSSSVEYKPVFCEQVVEIFSHITRQVAYMDREPQLTALRECVVQLFTCPTNAKMIFGDNKGYFIDIVWSVIDIFVDFSKIENGTLVWQRVQKTNPTKSYGISLKQGLYTIETLISKVDDANKLLKPAEFISVVTLCKLFNSAWKIKRKEGEHVLHEDQYFIPYLEYTTSIYSIIQTIVNALVNEGCDQALLLNAIKLINTFLGYKSLTYKLVHDSHEVIKFTVSTDRVAFMNPIHTFFSFLIENVPLMKAYETIVYQDSSPLPPLDSNSDNVDPMILFKEQYEDRVSQNFDFLKISDFALRSVVLCSQIDVGFWVRNGMSVLHQTSYYKNNPELNTYSRDIHLNQLAFLWEIDDTPRVIYNLLDRWELLDWFDGNAEFKHTIYEDKIFLIMQHFIAFVYQILTERQFFQTFDSPREKKMSQIKNAIMYSLYAKPLSYSKLLRLVPDYLTDNTTNFDLALNEISIFKEPRGLADNGVFKLKETLYSKIDPLRVSNLGNEFEGSATIIKKHLNKGKSDDANTVILQPQLVSTKHMDEGATQLGAFTRHPIFAKIVYKLLQVCLDNEDGTFLNELLHLIHGIFKDDEQVNGKGSLPEAYLSKPISNLLLSIVNSKSDIFSEGITSKADFLLKKMISKKTEEVFESLVAGFGQEYVDEYKNKKMSEGVNLEESERDRKRRLAKKHQAKMMAKFNNQQSKFMKEHEDEFKEKEKDGQLEEDGDVDMTAGEKIVETEDFTCSLCQDEDEDAMFVVPAYHDHSPIFKSGDITDPDQFLPQWNGFSNDDSGSVKILDEWYTDLKDNGQSNTRKVFVSCNHHIHYGCFRRYIQKKRFSTTAFICPLCQTFSNAVVPVPQSITSSNKIDILSHGGSLAESLRDYVNTNIETLMFVEPNLAQIIEDCQSFDKYYHKMKESTKAGVAHILASNWANTISMLEIASRLDANSNGVFLVGKEQKFKTLKNMLLFMILLVHAYELPQNMDAYDGEYSNDPDEEPIYMNKLFQFIVKDCLFDTQSSLKNSITASIFRYSKEFFEDYLIRVPSGSLFDMQWENIEKTHSAPENAPRGISFQLNHEMDLDPKFNDISREKRRKIINLAYTSFLQHLIPTLRRCLIMVKVMQLVVSEVDGEPFTLKEINVESDLIPEEGLSLMKTADKMLWLLTGYRSVEFLVTEDNVDFNYSQNIPSGIPHEFCGPIKLVDLSKYLNTYVTDTNAIDLVEENKHTRNSANRLDFKICLTCGVKIHLRSDRHEMSRHLTKHCFKSFGAFLIPNSSEVCLYLGHPPSFIYISAPYLNSHGEAGRNAMKRGDLTTLNLSRYEHLNRLWINNEIPGYISRVMGDEFRMSILSNGFLFTFNRDPRARRRVPPTNDDDSDENFGEISGDEDDDYYSDEDGDGENRFRNMNGQPGEVRDFFQIFETVRNAMDNGATMEEGVDLTAPFLQLFGPQFRGQNGDGEDDEETNGENPFQDPNDDGPEPSW